MQDWKLRDQNAGVENAGWKVQETTLYGTPHIAYVYSVLHEASVMSLYNIRIKKLLSFKLDV